MNIRETYDYLGRARRNFCTGRQAVPDEVLSHPLLNGDKFRCIKGLMFHMPPRRTSAFARRSCVAVSPPNLKATDL